MKKEEKKEKVHEYWELGIKNVNVIKEKFEKEGIQIHEDTIRGYIRDLKRVGKIDKLTVEERREKEVEFYNQGITDKKELANKLEVDVQLITKDFRVLKEEGRIPLTEQEQKIQEQGKTKEQVTEERREKVEDLYFFQAENESTVAEFLQIPKSTIKHDIEAIKKKKPELMTIRNEKLKEKEAEKRKRDLEEVEDLYFVQKMPKTKIVKKLHISFKTFGDYIKEIEEAKKPKEKASELKQSLDKEEIRKLCDEFKNEAETIEKFKAFILERKIKLEKQEFDKEEMPIIERIAELSNDIESTTFYLKLCIGFGRFGKAIEFANKQMEKDIFLEEQNDQIKALKERARNMIIAVNSLKREEGIEKAAQLSGLPEDTIKNLNRIIVQQAEKEKRQREKERRGRKKKSISDVFYKK